MVFVTLPKAGAQLDGHQSFGTIEAVKAVSELYAPLAGQVVDANPALENDPAAVNRDPYGDGLDDHPPDQGSGGARRPALAQRLPGPHRRLSLRESVA